MDTIASIATGMTEAGIGLIRISGPDAISIADRIYSAPRENFKIESWKGNTIHFGYIRDPENNEIIDEVMVSLLRAPHSYTTEDTVEINAHGGVFLTKRILELVLQNGARLAEPGEFTKRAFLGGRIDLARAEAVMDLISSRNESSRKIAAAQLEGSVSDKIREMRSQILHEIAFIESALDDPENFSMDGYPAKLKKKTEELADEIKRLLDRSEEGMILKNGIRTAIVGKPNAGKSSLLNFLSGTERAIVTEIEGTTRDTIDETVRLGEILLHLTDTAGIRETDDTVEKIGIQKTKQAVERSELILFLLDSSKKLSREDKEIASYLRKQLEEGKKLIVLKNKTDLPVKMDAEGEELFGKEIAVLSCSMKTGEGLEDLKKKIMDMFHLGEISQSNDVYITSTRHREALQNTLSSLKMVLQSIEENMGEDFFSIDLMSAYSSLGMIIGEQIEDDLVEEIFSKFCLGK